MRAVHLLLTFSLLIALHAVDASAAPKCVELFTDHSAQIGLPKVLNLRSEFVGEQTGVWVDTSSGVFGSVQQRRIFIKTSYLTDDQIPATIAEFDPQGRMISSFSGAMDFIFVVTLDRELRVAPKNLNDSSFARVKHSSLAQGQPLLMAGEISLNANRTVFSISNMSGHYRPPVANLIWFRDSFMPKQTKAKIKTIDVSARF